MQLIPVPLRYLVPSGKMLPPESIRSFWVDTRWTLDALATGALCFGASSPAEPSPPTALAMRKELWNLFEAHR